MSRLAAKVREEMVDALWSVEEAVKSVCEADDDSSFRKCVANTLVPFIAALTVIENLTEEDRRDYEAMAANSLARSLGKHGRFIRELSSEQSRTLADITDAYWEFGFLFGSVNMQAWLEAERREAAASAAALDRATATRRKAGDVIRDAAKAFIQANPNTSKSACARHVVQLLGKDQRGVERAIAELFEPRNLPRKQDTRPKRGL